MDETFHPYGASNKDPHVAVLSFPFSSHAMALFMLVRRLTASAAPNVMFSFFGTAKSNGMFFKNIDNDGLQNLKFYDVEEDGIPENYVSTPGKFEEEIELFMAATPWNFKKDEMGVPWLAFFIGEASGLAAHIYTDLIRSTIGVGKNAVAGREDETLGFIPGMSSACIRDLQDGIIVGNLESTFASMLHRMGKMLPRATAVLINTYEEVNPTIIQDLNSKFQKCLSVAPFTLDYPPQSDSDTTGCLSWLDKQKPSSVAYISFGTVAAAALPAHELEALAEGLEASGIPFLWSLKDKLKERLPVSFLNKTKERGLIVPWAPQMRVLQHTSVCVFMTQCGWSSVLESILAGVPVIGRPIFGDQPLNGWSISDVLGIGIRIDNGIFTKDGVIKGLDLVLFKEEGKKIMEKVQAFKELANQAIETDGTSTRNFKTLLQIVSST
ncbi:anthocyanidin 3-O-glucosyltransferase 7-like [Telopea speciosissima]|uniref:anthocyanidin 3-O-glucosyltransferase 7-like n=1 Tax=Telopea speciosissima TaxID=54955 RepID=UPI001CC54EB7|nr:anthocyanidin 3-O-glucosyltransferase 7-like [Telopea speciosissima]